MLPFLTDRNEIAQRGAGLHGCMFDELLTDGASSEAYVALLREFEDQPDCPARVNRDIAKTGMASPESDVQLQKLAPGPFRSRGGYLDYTDWKDRERFLELDMAIARDCRLYKANDELEGFLFTAA